MLKKLLLFAVLPVLTFAQPAEARRLFWWENVNQDPPPPSDYYDAAPPSDYYADQPDPYASQQDQFNQDQYLQYRRELDRRYKRRTYSQDPPPGYYDQPAFNPDRPYAAPIYPVQPRKKLVKKVAPKKPGVVPTVVSSKPAVMPAGPITANVNAPAPKAPPEMPTGSIMATPTTSSSASATAPVTASATPSVSAPAATASTTVAPPVKLAKGGSVSCDKGMGIVSSFGFTNVTSKSCTGSTLVYSAERSGSPFEIEVSAKSGELTAVKKL